MSEANTMVITFGLMHP